MIPSRTRYWVVVFAVTLAIIQYFDRVCISQMKEGISKDLGLSNSQMGIVFAAFTLAYALFEIPTGWLGDWMGPKKVLLRVTLWWSFFTAATGWAWNWTSLVVTRFLFGAGEAGCFPNLTKAFTVWLTALERVRAQGVLWTFSRWGGAAAPTLVVVMLQSGLTWRQCFFAFGGLGVLWTVWFYFAYRERPEEHPGVNEAERGLLRVSSTMAKGHGDVPWGRLVSSPSIWFLWIQYFCLSYGWYFYITWLPTYLREKHGVEIMKGALLSGVPLFLGGIGCGVSGFLSPYIARVTGNVKLVRRTVSFIGFLGAAFMLYLSMNTTEAASATVLMGLASFSNDLVMPGAWGACMDIGGKYAGTVSGSMNMMGNLGGVAAPAIIGQILDATKGDWTWVFYLSILVYMAGGVCWLFIDPVTPIAPADPQPEPSQTG